MSYFDYLPDDITANVIRYTSRRPRHPNWLAASSVSDVCTLTNCNKNVRRHVEQHVKHVIVTMQQLPLREENAVITHATKDSEHLTELFRQLSGNLTSVTIEKFALRCSISQSLKQILVEECTSLKSLVIEDFLDDQDIEHILRKRGSKLEELSLCFLGSMAKQYETYWSIVWKAACNLQALPRALIIERQLQSIADFCPNLKSLSLDFLSTSTLPIWWAVGGTLEKLSVRFSPTIDATRTLRFVEHHCLKLNSVEILASSSGFTLAESEAITRLYASYGPQLLRASMEDVDPACCTLVRARCPNVQCSVGHMYRVAEQLAILGPLVSEIRFDHLWNNINTGRGAQLRAAMAQCTNIEHITGRVLGSYCLWTLEVFCAVFDHPHDRLKSLVWPRWLIDKEDLGEAFHAVAINSKGLEKFQVHCESWQLGMCTELVEANANLKNVRISLDGQTFYATEVLLDIIQTFARCKHLEQLVINYDDTNGLARHIDDTKNAIFESCRSLRARDIFVRIGSIDYVA